jgi:hypothetical protein
VPVYRIAAEEKMKGQPSVPAKLASGGNVAAEGK